jgi:hypothetical protein
MDEHPPDNSLRLDAPKARRLSPAMEREAVGLLAALLLDAASRRAAGHCQNVVPIRPPLSARVGTPIGPPIKQRDPAEPGNPSKSMRSAA